MRGDGWTATWYSRRPAIGRQRLTGRIIGDLGCATTSSATGRILRARIVADTYQLDEPSLTEPACPAHWVPIPGTRRFWDAPQRPDRWGVADFTYCWTLAGFVCTAFCVDVYSRRILGWRVTTTKSMPLASGVLEQALLTRRRTDFHFTST